MVSMKLLLCCLALAAAVVVEGLPCGPPPCGPPPCGPPPCGPPPCPPKPCPGPPKPCPGPPPKPHPCPGPQPGPHPCPPPAPHPCPGPVPPAPRPCPGPVPPAPRPCPGPVPPPAPHPCPGPIPPPAPHPCPGPVPPPAPHPCPGPLPPLPPPGPHPCPGPLPPPGPQPCPGPLPPRYLPTPVPYTPRPGPICPDEWINNYFIEIDVTIGTDWNYIVELIKLIEEQKEVEEYMIIMDLYNQLQNSWNEYDSYYPTFRDEIYEQVSYYRNKYPTVSICYTERIVYVRKYTRTTIFPRIYKFRNLYFQVLDKLNLFFDKYNINRVPRAIAYPRSLQYNFDIYFPTSPHSNELSLLYQTCFRDYRYLYDLIMKLDFPDSSPLYPRKKQLMDDIMNAWITFGDYRRTIDIQYYPRFMDILDNQDLIDAIYMDILGSMRPYQIKFANIWFDIYFQYNDLCNQNNIPIVYYIDYDNFTPQSNIRGLYLPSPYLQEYFSHIIVTSRMDYLSAVRMWRELDFKPDSPQWARRNDIINELKKRLCALELGVNQIIRNLLQRFMNEYMDKLNNFDTQYRSVIDEIIHNSNKDLWPLLIAYREQYYVNDDFLLPIFQERNLVDVVTRSIIPCQTWGYDISVYVFDNDIRDLLQWIENCLRTNYYIPVSDLVQLKFPDDSEQYKLRAKALNDLELIWIDYRKVLHELYRKLIDLIVKRNCLIDSDEYKREIKTYIEWCRPRFIEIIDRFKKCCCSVNGVLDTLYTNDVTCTRTYTYVETSFEITIKGSVVVA